MCELELLNLLHRDPLVDGGWRVASPRKAALMILAAEQQEVSRRRVEAERLQETLEALQSTYLEAQAGPHQRPASCVVERSRTALEVFGEMVHLARSEVRIAHASSSLGAESLAAVLGDDPMVLRRGVEVKVLLQHATRSRLGIRCWATALVAAGAQVRTVAAVPAHVALVDGSCAVVPHGQDSGETLLIHETGLVRHLAAIFEASWSTSKVYPVDLPVNKLVHEPEVQAEARQKVLELLAQGATDDIVARRLQVSSRTIRRHVADLMRDIGASSRFQAGMLVERNGLLGPGHPHD